MILSRILRLLLVCALATAPSCHETTAAQSHIRERWYQQQPGYGLARPGVAAGVVFFGTGDGQIIARSQATGAAIWAAKVAGEQIGGANMVVKNDVLVVPISHETVALASGTGRELWRYAAPLDTTGVNGVAYPGQVLRTHITADDRTVYIPAWGASVSAIDLQTGARKWVWEPNPTPSDTSVRGRFRSGSQGVAVSGDTVYPTAWHFLDAGGAAAEAWLVALRASTGTELWRATMPQYTGGAFVGGAPVVSGGLVIFETIGGHEYAIDRFTGAVVWEYKPATNHATAAQTELYDGIVYHDGGDGFIYALRAIDGSRVWRSAGGVITSRDMLVTDRRLIYTDGRTIHILDRRSGQELLQAQQPRTSDPFFASAAAYESGEIFVTVGDGAWSFDEP